MVNATGPPLALPSPPSSLPFFLPAPFKVSPFTVLFPLLLLYPLLPPLLRHRRSYRTTNLYPPETYAHLTPLTAQRILLQLAQLEVPLIFETCLQFALFRTYGIPSISRLLHQTTLLSKAESAPKRYQDTDVLITEFVVNEWGGERWGEALARMNLVHAVYAGGRKGGVGEEQGAAGVGEKGMGRGLQIKKEDMLYTLSLFAWEPIRWMKRWEWRAASEVERCASGVFWKGVGDAMGIDYGVLPGGQVVGKCMKGDILGEGEVEGKGIRGWKDGLQWMDEIAAWAEGYEAEHMVPAASNHVVAVETVALLLVNVPSFAKAWGEKVIAVLMDERLRVAMFFPSPPGWLVVLVHSLLYTRRFVLRHLILPRPKFMMLKVLADEKNEKGKYTWGRYLTKPYYVKPSLGSRWEVKAWFRWMMGLPVPGDEGDKYFPDGYRIKELGPNVGKRGFEAEKKKVAEVGQNGCPMGFWTGETGQSI